MQKGNTNENSLGKTNSFPALAAMIAAVCAGEGSLITMPFVLGSITDRFDMTEGASGIVLSLQYAFMAITSTVISVYIHKVNRRALAIAAGTILIFAHVLAIVSEVWLVFLISRVCTGIGEGAALSIGNAVAAGTRRPHHTFTILTFWMVATATPMYFSVPVIAAEVGPLAVFYVLLTLVLICFPFLFAIPARRPEVKHPQKVQQGSVWRPFPWLLVGILCLYASNNTLWAFSERIGMSIGLSIQTISTAFLVTVVLTLCGPIAANITQRRWGFSRPIACAVILQFAPIFSLVYAMNAGMFFFGIILFNVICLYLVPYYRGLTAFLDPGGQLSSVSVLCQTLGTALGPFAGGVILLVGGGYASVGWMAACLVIISLLLSLHTSRSADREFFLEKTPAPDK